MRLNTSPINSGSLVRDVGSLVVVWAGIGARVALDLAEPVLASLLAWSGAAELVAGVLATESSEEGGAPWIR